MLLQLKPWLMLWGGLEKEWAFRVSQGEARGQAFESLHWTVISHIHSQ